MELTDPERAELQVRFCDGKKSFSSKVAAKRAVTKLAKPVRPYRCPVCTAVHLGYELPTLQAVKRSLQRG